MRAVMVEDAQVAPGALLDLLRAHLPYSLPVLRNYQFCRSLRGGPTPSSRALFARYQQPGGAGGQQQQQQQESPPEHFAAAYVDLARYPETQGYIYSTLDDVASSSAGDGNAHHNAAGHAASAQAAADELVLALLKRIRRIDEQHGQDSVSSSSSSSSSSRPRGKIMLGSLSEALRARLLALRLGILKSPNAMAQDGWDLYGKWLFSPGALAPLEGAEGAEGAEEAEKAMMALPRGMRWDRAGKEDMGVIRGAGSIRRTEETLLRLPSALIRLDDGTPVAWAFLSFDGSLISLHVEEPYRGQGIAKAVARRLMRDHLRDYGDDGWGAADVSVENEQSQGVCKSLGGKLGWLSSWLVIDLETVREPI